jgi:hypothetical protein
MGRPAVRRLDVLEKCVKTIGFRNWWRKVQEGEQWRAEVEKAKIHDRLWRPEIRNNSFLISVSLATSVAFFIPLFSISLSPFPYHVFLQRRNQTLYVKVAPFSQLWYISPKFWTHIFFLVRYVGVLSEIYIYQVKV